MVSVDISGLVLSIFDGKPCRIFVKKPTLNRKPMAEFLFSLPKRNPTSNMNDVDMARGRERRNSRGVFSYLHIYRGVPLIANFWLFGGKYIKTGV